MNQQSPEALPPSPVLAHQPPMSLPPWPQILALLVLGYWILCRSLRYRRANLIARKFAGRDPYSLTIDEAQWVVEQITAFEMPAISRFATAFGLFRTYGIVSIAPVLMK